MYNISTNTIFYL